MAESKSALRAPTYTLEDEARKLAQVAKAARRIINAPPDPQPRHRRNLLSHRLHEIDAAVENVHAAARHLRENIRAAFPPAQAENETKG